MKGVSKNLDVVTGAVPSLDSAFDISNNPGIMPRKDKADTPGTDTNNTTPHTVSGSLPSYPKGAGLKPKG